MSRAFALLLTSLTLNGCWSGDFVVAEVVPRGGAHNGGSAGISAASGAGGANLGGADGGAGGAVGPDCTSQALFVVGSETLTRGDSTILDRLRGLGFVVSIISAGMVSAESARTSDFVFISRSVRSPEVMASFREQPIPLFVTEYNLYGSLGMTDGTPATSGGDTLPSTELVIDDASHPLAAGLSGTVTVLEPGKGQYGFGVPGPGASVVATLVDEPQGSAIFAYEQGAPMVGLDAPARRVGYFLDIQASTRLTPAGWAMFDAAARWTAGRCITR